MTEVKTAVKQLIAMSGGEGSSSMMAVDGETETAAADDASARAAVRIHLFTLLFDDCSRLCVELVESTGTMQVKISNRTAPRCFRKVFLLVNMIA